MPMGVAMRSERTVIAACTPATRRCLADLDILDDRQLESLDPPVLSRLIDDPQDRQRLIDAIHHGLMACRQTPFAMPVMGMALSSTGRPRPIRGSRIHQVGVYAGSSRPLARTPGPLVKALRAHPYLPSEQRLADCSAHAFAAARQLDGRGGWVVRRPSIPFDFRISGALGGHAPGDGRSLPEVMAGSLMVGHIEDVDCPFGDGRYDEMKQPAAALRHRAAAGRSAGFLWMPLEGPGAADSSSVLDLARDLVHGHLLRAPVPLVIGVRIHAQWTRSYRSGVIRRHLPEEPAIGGHALVLCDILELVGPDDRPRPYAVVLNSWGKAFGQAGPLAQGGLGLIGLDYLGEILCGGCLVGCPTDASFQAMTAAVPGVQAESVLQRSLVAMRKAWPSGRIGRHFHRMWSADPFYGFDAWS
jgi:hypothetical protein